MYKLLNIDGNPKTVKGQKKGFMTAILYLAPYKLSGFNVCPMAEMAGCFLGCLNLAGHGGMAKGSATFNPHGIVTADNTVQRARIRKTRWFFENRVSFMAQLVAEIGKFQIKAAKKGLTPVVRLNGTSDILWEKVPVGHAANIMEVFPDLQFYDYTKVAKRFERAQPANYHLSLSYSEASTKYAVKAFETAYDFQASLVFVVRDAATKERAMECAGNNDDTGKSVAVDGDLTDLRFLDPKGSRVYLKAKGPARKDTSGFVLDL